MWKKDEVEEQTPQTPRPATAAPRPEAINRPPASSGERAAIGRSISIRGDVTGDEDLVIHGNIEGTVDLKQHTVTIGADGRVKAEVAARNVTVEGEVVGNIRAQEHAVLRSTARVEGDLTAPRVVMEEGAVFRGRIDMSEHGEKTARPKPMAVADSALLGKGEARLAAPSGEAKETVKA